MSEQGPGLGSGFRLQTLNLSSRLPKQTQQGQGCGIDRVIWRNSLSVLSLSQYRQYRLGSLTRDTIPLITDDIVTLSHYLGGRR